jgi:muconolactone delta-isomerase
MSPNSFNAKERGRVKARERELTRGLTNKTGRKEILKKGGKVIKVN